MADSILPLSSNHNSPVFENNISGYIKKGVEDT